MENIEVNRAEKSLILEALNALFHDANNQLGNKDLGYVQRANLNETKAHCEELMSKLSDKGYRF